MLCISLKHIHIEETVSFEIHSPQNVVVKGYFRHIHIFSISGGKEHPVVEEYVSYSGAGLIVCVHVRKQIFRTEFFKAWNRTHSSVYMDFSVGDIMPDGV